jgi:hypothetical protein
MKPMNPKNNLKKPNKVVTSAASIGFATVVPKMKPTQVDTQAEGHSSDFPYFLNKTTEKSKSGDNDVMSDSYSKDTIDAKFETLEQKMLTMETRIDGKLDLVLTKMDLGFSNIHTRIDDLWKVILVILAAIVGLYVQGAFQKPTAPPEKLQIINQIPAPPAPVQPAKKK